MYVIDQLFEDFAFEWNDLDKNDCQPMVVLNMFQQDKRDSINFCKSQLEMNHARDDYLEVLELVLKVLGAEPDNFSWKLPGAYHKARWNAVIIYGLKIYLFRNQLGFDNEKCENLERLAKFVCFIYVKHWFLSPVASYAPQQDLNLYRRSC